MQFRLDKYRPDLTKLDDMVARLACESGHFSGLFYACFGCHFLMYIIGQVSAFGQLIKTNGLPFGLQGIKKSGGDFGLFFSVQALGETIIRCITSIPLVCRLFINCYI